MKISLSPSVSQMWDVCNVWDNHLIAHITVAIFLHRETYYGQKGVLCSSSSSSSPLTTNKVYFRHQNVGLAGRLGEHFQSLILHTLLSRNTEVRRPRLRLTLQRFTGVFMAYYDQVPPVITWISDLCRSLSLRCEWSVGMWNLARTGCH